MLSKKLKGMIGELCDGNLGCAGSLEYSRLLESIRIDFKGRMQNQEFHSLIYYWMFLYVARIIVLHVKRCVMKTNITLKIEMGLLREARVLAAEKGTSISALLAAQLEHAVRERKGYEQARQRAVARLRKGFDLQWTPPTSRDELHER